MYQKLQTFANASDKKDSELFSVNGKTPLTEKEWRRKFILLMDLMNKNEDAAKNTGNLGVVLEKVRNLGKTLKNEENQARLEIPEILTIVLSFEGEQIKLNTFKAPGFPGHVMGTPGPCALLEILQHLQNEKRIQEDTVVQVDDADKGIDYSSMGFERYNSSSTFKSTFWRLEKACSWRGSRRVF